MSDELLEIAMRNWAHEAIDSTPTTSFSVAGASRESIGLERPPIRRLLPLLAVGLVLALAGSVLVLRHSDHSRPAVGAHPKCPPQAPTIGPGGLQDRHRSDSIFAQPVAEMTACVYVSAGNGRVRLAADVGIPHKLASDVADLLNGASAASDDPYYCAVAFIVKTPTGTEQVRQFVLVARTADGTTLPPVTVLAGCKQLTATVGDVAHHFSVSDPTFGKLVERALR